MSVGAQDLFANWLLLSHKPCQMLREKPPTESPGQGTEQASGWVARGWASLICILSEPECLPFLTLRPAPTHWFWLLNHLNRGRCQLVNHCSSEYLGYPSLLSWPFPGAPRPFRNSAIKWLILPHYRGSKDPAITRIYSVNSVVK